MKRIVILLSTLGACACIAIQGWAQIAVPPPAPEVAYRSPAELDQLLGPIALYPDPLIAEILPAATLPSQIVIGDRYVNGGGDPNLIDQQPWDPSIKALARYPALIKWMDDNLAWTTALGQAFLYQQQDVMNAVQRLRAQALALGNLQSTAQQTVVNENGLIEILPANPQYVYVPVYQPQVVYYERPVVAPLVTFGLGLAIGPWLNHDFDWHDHRVIVWRRSEPRPPGWWFDRRNERHRIQAERARVWQPRHPAGLVARDMDRGWGERRPDLIRGFNPAPGEHREARPAPGPQHTAPVVIQRPPETREHRASGALVGIQSSREVREFSHRGQESRQAISRPPPPPSVSHGGPPAFHGGGPPPGRPGPEPGGRGGPPGRR